MTLRHGSNDHFWFTFLHELGHLVLHRRTGVFADDDASDLSEGKEEREADEWAEEMLVGRARFGAFCRREPRSKIDVETFAHEVGVHPGVVVGMLQHRRVLPWTHLNGLKQRLDIEACSRAARPRAADRAADGDAG
jgi:HTH-type transcriptional regulator/antitoxin HigA